MRSSYFEGTIILLWFFCNIEKRKSPGDKRKGNWRKNQEWAGPVLFKIFTGFFQHIDEGEDVTLDSQVMMMGDKMPVVLTSGQKKTIRTTAGTYQIMVMMQSKEALIFQAR